MRLSDKNYPKLKGNEVEKDLKKMIVGTAAGFECCDNGVSEVEMFYDQWIKLV